MLIDCPECGPRDEVEFHYGGPTHVGYPADPSELTDEQWATYLYYRTNSEQVLTERWVHSSGCRRWLVASRDPVTYRMLGTWVPGATGIPG